MSVTRVLLNIAGFFALLDGCLGVSSPDVSKRLMLAVIERFHITILRILTFLWGMICAIIFYGAVTSGLVERFFGDYLLIFGSALFAIFYILLALTIPRDLKDSGLVRHILELPDSRYRLYGVGTVSLGIFLVFNSVRY